MIFEMGDWVWLHLRKERFPSKRRNKLSPRGDGPFQILERIGDNAYKLDLPGEYNVSATFNVSDLSPFDVGDDHSGTNALEEGRNDGIQCTLEGKKNEELHLPLGPITRSRAKRLKSALHTFIQDHLEQGAMQWSTLEGHQGTKEATLSLVVPLQTREDILGGIEPNGGEKEAIGAGLEPNGPRASPMNHIQAQGAKREPNGRQPSPMGHKGRA